MAYSFMDLAADVLASAETPLTYQEIWSTGQQAGLAGKVRTVGKTPWNTLGAQLYVDVRDNEASRFIKIGKRPARFFLKARSAEITDEVAARIEIAAERPQKAASGYMERDLHAVLTYFAYANPAFNRGRQVITKTIFHEKSKGGGYQSWTHPDIVGFSVPLEDWSADVIDFNELSERNALTVFSFELKRSITKGTYRESFFQAVSNSSWAHRGYLVAAEIAQDDDLLAELDRLASSFGIGIIHLNLHDLSESRVVYPAKIKTELDWETINKLCEQNDDFRKFLQSVKIDVSARKVHRSEYDSVKPDIDDYVAKLLSSGV
ncbi:MAG: hypothetical protein JXA57_10430 [Armatimonadetes bacterium]|nr:hypothetical protein [Armatimonadota bacterium]